MSPPQGLTEPQVLTVARGLLAELARVHDAGGVSGALGPATVLVDEGGAVRLVGGQVDPVYASPEVLAGQPPTVRSDLYSAGAVLAHLFRGEPTVPPMVTDLDPGIAWLLGPVLAADPGARPGSAAAMVTAVDQLAEQRHGSEWRVAAGFVGATGVVGGVPVLVLAAGGTASAAGAVGAAGGAAGLTGVAGVAGAAGTAGGAGAVGGIGAAGSAGAVGGAGATGVGAGAAGAGGAGAGGSAAGAPALAGTGASGQVAAAGGVVAPQGGLLGVAAPGAGAPAAAGGASASGAAGTGQGVVGTGGAQAAGHTSHAVGGGISKGLAIKVGAIAAAGTVGVAGAAAAVIVLTGGGETKKVELAATSDIYLAGADDETEAQLSDPGTKPVSVDVDGAGKVSFPSVKGDLSACSGCEPESPDGGSLSFGSTGITAFNGIAGVTFADRTLFVVGVFVGDDQPTQADDAVVDLSGADDEKTQKPDLGEPFFIGNGETGDGDPQEVVVPDDATTLYLGFADGYGFYGAPGAYGDNTGSVDIEVTVD